MAAVKVCPEIWPSYGRPLVVQNVKHSVSIRGTSSVDKTEKRGEDVVICLKTALNLRTVFVHSIQILLV